MAELAASRIKLEEDCVVFAGPKLEVLEDSETVVVANPGVKIVEN